MVTVFNNQTSSIDCNKIFTKSLTFLNIYSLKTSSIKETLKFFSDNKENCFFFLWFWCKNVTFFNFLKKETVSIVSFLFSKSCPQCLNTAAQFVPLGFPYGSSAATHGNTMCWRRRVCFCPTHAPLFINSGGPQTTALGAVPMHHHQSCLAAGERPQICQKKKKKSPQMTIKPGQYFMEMKCSGTVYRGGG